MLKKQSSYFPSFKEREFPDFVVDSGHDIAEFQEYRRNMGFEPIKLKDSPRTNAIIKRIIEATQKINPLYANPVLHGRAELEALYEVALGLHDDTGDSGHIIQCGTYRGSSAAVLAMAIKDRRAKVPVITIDTFEQEHIPGEEDVFIAHKKLLETLELTRHIASVWHNDMNFMSNCWNLPIRLAVMDSEHSYEHTWHQIKTISPYIVPGGWMVFHDYKPQSIGVPRAIHEWLCQLNRTNRLFESPVYVFIQLL